MGGGETGDLVLGLVFKKAFVGLTVACALCAAPALAKPDHAGPPEHAGGPHGQPPGQAEQEEQASAPPAAADPAPPAQEEAAPEEARPPPPRRFGIRSVPAPSEPEQVATPAPKRAEMVQPEPRRRPSPPPRRRLHAERPAPAAATFRRATPPPAPAADEAAPRAVAASSSGPKRASRQDSTRSERVTPAEPLPARVVPRPVRQIAAVVPSALWALLAGLALLACALAVSSWMAAMRARRLSRQREELLQEVGLLQTALLPPVPSGTPVSVAYRPADGARAGGDFYDAFELPGERTGVILGDVSGHGRDALARTTFVRYTLRAYVEAGLEPREVLKIGSHALAEHLDGGFATVAIAVYERASGQFTYASAGHPPPVVVGAAEPFEPVTACSAPPLGVDEATGFRQTTFTLSAGARACLYTDGVTDARSNGRLLGAARLEAALEALPADADAEELIDAVADMADEVPDDMAVCLVSAPPGVPVAGPRVEEIEVDEYEVGDALERFLRACGVALGEVPGILREAGEAARREGSATVRVRSGEFRPGVDVVPVNLVRLAERQRALR